ncbi:type VI secretion system baseplate subunit TssK [Planctobacterium marinum]|uniref:type VI secretion system baseplate subunit TssK n=1 Tax=Planctobacterium marinum TaxID=1631968 RepID=UPI001E4D8794|nr:type VI secretion system baseplate subunit TssK [Planctobacterium marinum]MCC2604024.1 type VI secretion system baseplate subunit TssK [Planctobacterium marinum]
MKNISVMPDPVQWFEGMLLSPQHFQQNNIYLEQAMFHQLQRTNPFYWGVCELEIDQDAVTFDQLIVNKVHAVMPDGTVVKHALSQQQAMESEGLKQLSIQLSEIPEIEPQKPFYVHLAIPALSDGCASDVDSELKRYDSVNEGKVIDQNDIQNKIDLVRLRTRLILLVDSQLSPNFRSFPILKMEKTYDGSFQILNYTPPVLYVPKVDAPYQVKIGKDIEALLGDLRTKATGLRNFFTDTQGQNSIVSAVQKQRIHYLTSCLPGVEVLLNSQMTHPQQLYLALVNLAGNMAIIHPDLLPPSFSEYRHNDIDGTFKALFSFIKDITESIRLDFTCIPFEINEDHEYSVSIDQLPEDGIFYLSLKQATGSSPDKLKQWLDNAMIATDNNWELLLLSRTLGADRTPVKEFKNLKLLAGDEELFIEIKVDREFIAPKHRLMISGSDQSLADHQPAVINWFIPRKSG